MPAAFLDFSPSHPSGVQYPLLRFLPPEAIPEGRGLKPEPAESAEMPGANPESQLAAMSGMPPEQASVSRDGEGKKAARPWTIDPSSAVGLRRSSRLTLCGGSAAEVPAPEAAAASSASSLSPEFVFRGLRCSARALADFRLGTRVRSSFRFWLPATAISAAACGPAADGAAADDPGGGSDDAAPQALYRGGSASSESTSPNPRHAAAGALAGAASSLSSEFVFRG